MSNKKAASNSSPITTEYRYRYSFTARFIQADEEVQRRYGEIKNHLLSYKGVKCRTAWGYESFRYGRDTFLKIKIRGKAPVLFMDLDAKNLDKKYHAEDLTKKDGSIPPLATKIRVGSARGVKYAKELIDLMMNHRELTHGVVPAVDYTVPYRTSYKLLGDGLIKIVYNKKAVLLNELPADVVKEVAVSAEALDNNENTVVTVNHVSRNNKTVIINEVEENNVTTVINKSVKNSEVVEEHKEEPKKLESKPADKKAEDKPTDEKEHKPYVNPVIAWGSIAAELVIIAIIALIVIL